MIVRAPEIDTEFRVWCAWIQSSNGWVRRGRKEKEEVEGGKERTGREGKGKGEGKGEKKKLKKRKRKNEKKKEELVLYRNQLRVRNIY